MNNYEELAYKGFRLTRLDSTCDCVDEIIIDKKTPEELKEYHKLRDEFDIYKAKLMLFDLLMPLFDNELLMYIDNDNNKVYCTYETYVRNCKNKGITTILSEKDFNLLIETLKRSK